VGIGSPVDHWLNGKLRTWSADLVGDRSLSDLLSKGNNLSSGQVTKVWQDINLKLIQTAPAS
jgi:hypothetical protein